MHLAIIYAASDKIAVFEHQLECRLDSIYNDHNVLLYNCCA